MGERDRVGGRWPPFNVSRFEPVNWPKEVHTLFVWSGRSASTSDFLGRLAQWRSGHGADYASHMGALSAIARTASDAVTQQQGRGFVEAATAYAAALRAFGTACGLDIFSAEHVQLAELAAAGRYQLQAPWRGGGDFGVAFALEPDRLARLENAALLRRFRCVPLAVDEQGVLHLEYTGYCQLLLHPRAGRQRAVATNMSVEQSSAERSRFPAFYKLSVSDRVRIIHERGWVSAEDYQALISGDHTLKVHKADKMIENVVGVMGLPVGLGLNFLVNGRDYIVPLVVEEPSIVAALSSAAKVVRGAGGFSVESTEPVLIGQVQVVDVPHVAKAKAILLQRKDELLNLANSLHPQMVARGGGAQDVEVHLHARAEGGDMLVVHLLVDTRDAMGANLVNTMCEGVASLVESITGGRVFLRILSNLTDRAMVRARCVIPVDKLGGRQGYTGEEVRDGVILANEFASIDPYRAATHNKGIMNGVDAVALATGNDWRAIEAAAHAYAARGGRYTSLTRWYKGEQGELVGELEMPMKVGIVGGSLQSNATVALNLRLLGVKSARELAEVMGAVGLAQNFSALRALVTEGIQQGHMTLHARSVAITAGATAEIFDTVVERLVESGEIKIWKAQEIVLQVRKEARGTAIDPKPDQSSARSARPVATARSSCSASTPWCMAVTPSPRRCRWRCAPRCRTPSPAAST